MDILVLAATGRGNSKRRNITPPLSAWAPLHRPLS